MILERQKKVPLFLKHNRDNSAFRMMTIAAEVNRKLGSGALPPMQDPDRPN